MDTILVLVTLLSLGMAITMSLVAWKLLREERRRASARITALAADAQRPPVFRPARNAEPPREANKIAAPAARAAAARAEASSSASLGAGPATPLGAGRAAGRAPGWPPRQDRPAPEPPLASTVNDDRSRPAPAARVVDVYIHGNGRSERAAELAEELVSRRSESWHESRSAAPGWQGATSENIGNMRARSNAASRDAPPGNHATSHCDGTLTAAPQMFATSASSHSRRGVPFAAVMGALTVLLLGGAVLAVNHGIGSAGDVSTATEPTTAPLELVSLHHLREGDRLSVEGRVRNPTVGSELKQVNAVVFLFDHSGAYISTGRAPIEFRTLEPGQESRFTVALPNATTVGRYRVSFRADGGGVVPHIDRRETSPLATVSNIAVQ